MKAIMFVMFLTILKFSTIKSYKSDPSKWILDIKNENYTDDLIELRPGVLKRIILSIRQQGSITDCDKDSIYKVNFTITSSTLVEKSLVVHNAYVVLKIPIITINITIIIINFLLLLFISNTFQFLLLFKL